jgi:hypothetical protein
VFKGKIIRLVVIYLIIYVLSIFKGENKGFPPIVARVKFLLLRPVGISGLLPLYSKRLLMALPNCSQASLIASSNFLNCSWS